ncbi:hypothetical protein QL285_007490 [Trifolium repens]|nr:hypothetical protein QL285_007490 [Trifolium repens]
MRNNRCNVNPPTHSQTHHKQTPTATSLSITSQHNTIFFFFCHYSISTSIFYNARNNHRQCLRQPHSSSTTATSTNTIPRYTTCQVL